VPDFATFGGEIVWEKRVKEQRVKEWGFLKNSAKALFLKGDVRISGQGDLLDSDVNKSSVTSTASYSKWDSLTSPLQEGASGFDAWLSQFPREEEIQLVAKTLLSLKQNPRRIHFAGISCAESVELFREYYRERGYEDALAKNYTLPTDELVTVSVNLRHLLWCEKDKRNLEKTRTRFFEVTPPLRSPHDLRSLQQAARMGIIMWVEVFPDDEYYLSELLTREILTPFQITQLLSFRWEKYGFAWEKREMSLFIWN
jgi:dihydroorotase-like cyclic amidohydrolase